LSPPSSTCSTHIPLTKILRVSSVGRIAVFTHYKVKCNRETHKYFKGFSEEAWQERSRGKWGVIGKRREGMKCVNLGTVYAGNKGGDWAGKKKGTRLEGTRTPDEFSTLTCSLSKFFPSVTLKPLWSTAQSWRVWTHSSWTKFSKTIKKSCLLGLPHSRSSSLWRGVRGW
jgi:hypothetical protein